MLSVKYVTQPSKLIIPVDKLSSELFGLDEDELTLMIKNKNLAHEFKESEPRYEEKSANRKNTATTKFKFWYHGDRFDVVNLTFFDQLIFSVCMTEFLRGVTVVTPNIIFRDLGGAKRVHHYNYTTQILNSLQKLSQLEMILNATEAANTLFQIKGDKFKHVQRGFVLPAEEVEVRINGQICNGYQIQEHSLVFEYAQCKGQVVQVPIEHLNVPHTKNTLTFMLVKLYIYMRILRINRKLFDAKTTKQEKLKPQSIVLNTLFSVCGLTKKLKDWQFRLRLMKQIIQYMDHLIKCKVISNYQLTDPTKTPQKHLKDCTKIVFNPIKPTKPTEENKDDEED